MSDKEEVRPPNEAESPEEQAEKIENIISAQEEITVHYPSQTFTPAEYCRLEVGNLFYKTFVHPGETPEDAYMRGFMFLRQQVRDTFPMLIADYEERSKMVKNLRNKQ